MDVQAAFSAASAAATSGQSYAFGNNELGGGDFLRLMIEQLVNQDPLEPMKNQELLAQVSQIRNMETLSNLDETLAAMTYQQQMTSAGALIGKQVSGISTAGTNVSGVITRVLSSVANGVTLVTAEGDSIYVHNVTAIEEVSDNG